MSFQPPDDAVPEAAGVFLVAEVSGGDGAHWWQAATYYLPAGLAALWAGLAGPFDGTWRLLTAIAAGALAYLAVFLMVMIVMLVRTWLHGQKIRRDPRRYFENATGKPWPPGRPQT